MWIAALRIPVDVGLNVTVKVVLLPAPKKLVTGLENLKLVMSTPSPVMAKLVRSKVPTFLITKVVGSPGVPLRSTAVTAPSTKTVPTGYSTEMSGAWRMLPNS